MEIQLLKTIYIYIALIFTIFMSAFLQKKESCTCHMKAPASFIGLASTLAIGFVFGFTPMIGMFSFFLLAMTVGSVLFGKVSSLSGGIAYLVGFIGLFAGINLFGIKDIINMSIEYLSLFGALCGIILINLKKQESTVFVYVIGVEIFFLSASSIQIIPITIAATLIALSEIMLIFNNEKEEKTNDYKRVVYFSASLFSYGVLLLPLAFM